MKRAFMIVLLGLTLPAATCVAQTPDFFQGVDPLGKQACEVLTVADVSSAVGAPLKVEADASGPDDLNRENCVWSDGKVTVAFQAQRVKDRLTRNMQWAAVRGNAFGNMDAGTPVAGVGEEAFYRDWTGGAKGGAIVALKAEIIWVLSGNVSRDALVALTKTAGSRL
jgi:hypothetical protein